MYIHTVAKANPFALDQAAGRRHPFGVELIQRAMGILNSSSLAMHIEQESSTHDVAKLSVELTREPGENSGATDHFWEPTSHKKTSLTLIAYTSG